MLYLSDFQVPLYSHTLDQESLLTGLMNLTELMNYPAQLSCTTVTAESLPRDNFHKSLHNVKKNSKLVLDNHSRCCHREVVSAGNDMPDLITLAVIQSSPHRQQLTPAEYCMPHLSFLYVGWQFISCMESYLHIMCAVPVPLYVYGE